MRGKNNTFWMVPRAVLNPELTSSNHQRALITYNILFSGSLIMSDSDIINNTYLRLALRSGDEFVQGLFEHNLIQIANRSVNGGLIPLGKTSETIAQRPGGLLKGIISGDAPELKWIEKFSAVLPYDLGAAAPRYQTEILRLLKAAKSIRDFVPDSVALAIASFSEETIAAGGALSWSLYAPESELWAAVHARLRDDSLRERYGQRIFEIARGPYSTFLPSILNVGATYSTEDQIGIDLWRGRSELSEIELDRKTVRVPMNDLADMVAGLSRLTTSEILRLRGCAARTAYEKACEQFNPGSSNLSDVMRPLLEYRAEINDAIANELHRSHSQDTEDLSFTASTSAPPTIVDKVSYYAYEEYNQVLTFACRGMLSFLGNALTLGKFGALQFAYSRIQSYREPSFAEGNSQLYRVRTEREVEHRLAAIELQKEDKTVIEGTGYVDGGNCDLFSTLVTQSP